MNIHPLSLRSYKGKKLVSYLRGGDYAHAGEIESIQMVMSRFPKDTNRCLLDVGCGLGGTAHYLQHHNWGQVCGIDIERQSIEHAKNKYPTVKFYAANVVDVKFLFSKNKFDLICMFNSFYAFKQQSLALQTLKEAGKKNSQLAIFDYSDPLVNLDCPLFKEGDEIHPPFKPIKIQKIANNLLENGWQLKQMIDITDHYLRWYQRLITKLENENAVIIRRFGQGAYNTARITYLNIYNALTQKILGGVILYAEKLD